MAINELEEFRIDRGHSPIYDIVLKSIRTQQLLGDIVGLYNELDMSWSSNKSSPLYMYLDMLLQRQMILMPNSMLDNVPYNKSISDLEYYAYTASKLRYTVEEILNDADNSTNEMSEHDRNTLTEIKDKCSKLRDELRQLYEDTMSINVKVNQYS